VPSGRRAKDRHWPCHRLARKITTLDATTLPEGTLLGIAAVVVALVLGYYVLQRSRREMRNAPKK